MRREGRQHGWVLAYDRDMVDPEGRLRAVHPVAGPTVSNGGFVRAPRKPTNHSKFTGGRVYAEFRGKAGSSSPSCKCKGRRKFKHDELKTNYLEGADALYGRWDDRYDMDS